MAGMGRDRSIQTSVTTFQFLFLSSFALEWTRSNPTEYCRSTKQLPLLSEVVITCKVCYYQEEGWRRADDACGPGHWIPCATPEPIPHPSLSHRHQSEPMSNPRPPACLSWHQYPSLKLGLQPYKYKYSSYLYDPLPLRPCDDPVLCTWRDVDRCIFSRTARRAFHGRRRPLVRSISNHEWEMPSSIHRTFSPSGAAAQGKAFDDNTSLTSYNSVAEYSTQLQQSRRTKQHKQAASNLVSSRPVVSAKQSREENKYLLCSGPRTSQPNGM